MKCLSMIFTVGCLLIVSRVLWACPAGQTCPSGKDCVADSSLCVASSSSSSTSSGGTSSAPSTTKDQLGLTLEPLNSFVPVFNFENKMISWTFYSPATLLPPVIEGGGATSGDEANSATFLKYNLDSLSKGSMVRGLISLDGQNAPIPSREGGIWGLPSDVTVH